MSSYRPRFGQSLTRAEYLVVRCVVEVGGSADAVGFELNLDPSTVRGHLYHAAIKLGTAGLASTASATVAAAFRRGLLQNVRALAQPTSEYRVGRMFDPYTIRHPDGTSEQMMPWMRPVSMGGPD